MNQDIDIIGIEHQTAKAVLFNCSGSKQFWCPKAMIIDLHDEYVTVYSNFRPQYIHLENDSEDLFDDISDEEHIETIEVPKKKFKRDKSLDWLLDPNWKPKKVYYNGVRIK